ncbi:uncharacterized protein BDV17DRAFT_87776 [Aspergillus undulatus]|uniref:uncharacterized protein n=1 Tax=Aspergillus undulatus TaxID=1810928 RepID=UPI003CCD0643
MAPCPRLQPIGASWWGRPEFTRSLVLLLIKYKRNPLKGAAKGPVYVNDRTILSAAVHFFLLPIAPLSSSSAYQSPFPDYNNLAESSYPSPLSLSLLPPAPSNVRLYLLSPISSSSTPSRFLFPSHPRRLLFLHPHLALLLPHPRSTRITSDLFRNLNLAISSPQPQNNSTFSTPKSSSDL